MASTLEVFDHHVQRLVARDVSKVPEDYGDNSVFIVWNAESETVIYDFATDTFVVEDGKIALQTVGFVKHDKG